MKHLSFGLLMFGALALPQPAMARNQTAVGVGAGVLAGALVAGPVGAVVGGIVGGVVGSNSDKARPRRARRLRAVRARRPARPARLAETSVAVRPTSAPVADATARPAQAAPLPTTSSQSTSWTNPR